MQFSRKINKFLMHGRLLHGSATAWIWDCKFSCMHFNMHACMCSEGSRILVGEDRVPGYDFIIFSPKLHEIDNILSWGVTSPKSATVMEIRYAPNPVVAEAT